MGIFSKLFRSKHPTDEERPAATRPGSQPQHSPNSPVRPVYSVLDVETTGLSPRAHRIVELAIVRLNADGTVVDEWVARFNPEGAVGATHIHGITQDDVKDAPLFASLVPDINARLAGTVVVAHNASFDIAFIRAEYQRAGWEMPFVPTLCTLKASWHYLPALDRRRLTDCCTASGVRLEDAHSALGDARATASMFADWLRRSPAHPDLAEAPMNAAAVIWPAEAVRAPQVPSKAQVATDRRARAMARPQAPALVSLLGDLDLSTVEYSNAPENFEVYVEKLVEVLEDGVLDAEEAAALADLAEVYDLDEETVTSAHAIIVNLMAHLALADSKITRGERDELRRIALELNVDPDTVPDLIDAATAQRLDALSAKLPPLPVDWPYGEPLRMGDKVALTGGDAETREKLETLAGERGVIIMNNVSRFTALLVSDGQPSGKAAKAAEIGTRVVTHRDFVELVRYVQPRV